MLDMVDDQSMQNMLNESMHADAQRVHAEFYLFAEHNHEKSQEAGRPIYDNAEYICKMIPGDKDNIIRRPVRLEDKVLYSAKYEAFKRGLSQPESGTPLDTLPFLTKAQVQEFKAFNVRTAEQVVSMPDTLKQSFMGVRSVIKRIEDFLAAARGNAPMEKMRNELEKRDEQIAGLQQAIRDQAARLSELQKSMPKQP
jgi:hypothetical protein